MKYKDLKRTFEIIADKNPNDEIIDNAYHDVWGMNLEHIDLSALEVRELAEIGWRLGITETDCDEDDELFWREYSILTDEELMVLWNKYKRIFKYA